MVYGPLVWGVLERRQGSPQTNVTTSRRHLKAGMLGNAAADVVDLAGCWISIKNNISALRADELERFFVTGQNVGLSGDATTHHGTAPVNALITQKSLFDSHFACSIEADANRIDFADFTGMATL